MYVELNHVNHVNDGQLKIYKKTLAIELTSVTLNVSRGQCKMVLRIIE